MNSIEEYVDSLIENEKLRPTKRCARCGKTEYNEPCPAGDGHLPVNKEEIR